MKLLVWTLYGLAVWAILAGLWDHSWRLILAAMSRTCPPGKERDHPRMADRTRHNDRTTPTEPASGQYPGSDILAQKRDRLAQEKNMALARHGWPSPYANEPCRTSYALGGVSPVDRPPLVAPTRRSSPLRPSPPEHRASMVARPSSLHPLA